MQKETRRNSAAGNAHAKANPPRKLTRAAKKQIAEIIRQANAGMNPKALQYIMGHSNINMTLNYYAHATSDSAMAEMERLIA